MIICGNNVDVLKQMEPEIFDLVVTSPPYDDLRDYNGFSTDTLELIIQLHRTIKVGGIVCWITGDQADNYCESGTSMKTALKFMENGFNLYDTMIYHKSGIQKPSDYYYYQCWEYIFLFSKGKPKTLNFLKDRKNKYAGHTCRGKVTSRQKDGTLKEGKNRVIGNFSKRTNIWEYAVGKQNSTADACAFKHPAIMPEKLAQDLILSFSNANDLVLDPFLGSGTTMKMAKILGRKCIGIEISEEYCKISEERISDIIESNEV